MTTDKLSQAIFGKNIEADQPAPILERERLKDGAVVQHKGTRQVKTANGGSAVHSFALVGAPDGTPWFSLWGSANLNSQLRKARPGAVLLLAYNGQEPADDGTPGAHLWTVKPSTVQADVLAKFLAAGERPRMVRELAESIAAAHAAERERREARRAGNPAAPEHTDDDFPF